MKAIEPSIEGTDRLQRGGEGASRSEQYKRKNNRLEQTGFDQCFLEYLQSQFIRT